MTNDYPKPTAGQARRTFKAELTRKVNDPSRLGAPGSLHEMLRGLAAVVLDAHELDTDGTCVGHFDAYEGQWEWPCDEVVRMGRIYGVWWVRP
jgi:hypothetical protein